MSDTNNESPQHTRQLALVKAMLDPAFYPHETEAEIGHVQTHLSHVLLTGPYAYKINKAIDLGFVDYSTLEKRGHSCSEEVRLNQLYAPDLYLDVVSIYQSDKGFSLVSDASTLVEYAVKMREFRQEDLLVHALEDNELSAQDVEFMARQLGRFHAEAKADAEISAYGSPECVASVAVDTLEVLRSQEGDLFTEEDYACLYRFTQEALGSLRGLLLDRVKNGRIRECHGDLHLNNICRYRGKIEFFDRIVFNEAFKNIDVMYDLAFLYMDFEYRRRPDLANRFLNVYLEQSNDFHGVPLLRFYACCRALIRAEVLAIEAREEEVPEAERPGIEREAQAHFMLGLRYAKAASPARVTIMCGLSGSGKSTVARELAARSAGIYIRSDAVRKHLADSNEGLYTEAMNEKTYGFVIQQGVQLAVEGYPVFLDATFSTRAFRQRALGACREHGLEFRIVYCAADHETLEHRLQTRTEDISDADTEVLRVQFEAFESLDEDESGIVVDTRHPIDYERLIG